MVKLINLGCGKKAHADWINIDASISISIARNPLLKFLLTHTGFLRGERLRQINDLPSSIIKHDLSKGIPFPNNSFDMAYHSHVLEHIDRDTAPDFILECFRVLKPGGILRVAVPDLERLCREYLAALANPVNAIQYDKAVHALLEQMVRRESHGTSQQKWLRRKIENWLLGDARSRGETHQWMYDRVSLPILLEECGFVEASVTDYRSSMLPNWSVYGLELNEAGGEYKTDSLYVEARKPL